MKLKPILAAFAVTLSALASTAMAVETFTQDAAGNLTHVRGIAVDPIQTPEQARINAEKHIAAMKAKEAAQAAAKHATRNPLPTTAPQELFYTGKPYLEETGQYLFLFRHYDPELSRWTTADPSGFPDGANNQLYVTNTPHSKVDWAGLVGKSVAVLYGWYDASNQASFPNGWHDSDFHNLVSSTVAVWNDKMAEADAKPNSNTHYIDDGDYLSFASLTSWTQLGSWLSYGKIWVIAHGNTQGTESYFVNGVGWSPANVPSNVTVWGCNPIQGAQTPLEMGALFWPVSEYLRE